MPVDPRLDLELPAADRIHGERPGEAIVPEKAQRLLAPARPSAPVPDDGAERVVAVADDRRGDGDAVADAGLGRPAAAVHLRRDVGDHDARSGHARHTVNSPAVRLERSLGVQLHPTSLPGGRLGPDAYAFVDWLHEAGGQLVAGASTHPARHLRIAVYIGIRVRRLGRPPRRPGGAGRSRRGARVPRARGRLARRLGGVRGRRRPRGAGALRARVGRAPRLCRGSRRADRRRPADLRRGGRLRPRARTPSSSSRSTRSSPARRRTPSTSTASAGETRSTTGTRSRGRGTAGGSTGCTARSSLADLFRIDHFRGFAAYWAVPAGAQSARGGAWRPGPGRAVFDAARAELGDLPVVAEDLGVITPDVRELRRCARLPRHGGDDLGVLGRTRQPAPAGEPPSAPGRLHVHARHRHARGRVRRAGRLAPRRADARRPSASWRSSPRRTCSVSGTRRG